MRLLPAANIAEQSPVRHFALAVLRGQISGKAANGRETLGTVWDGMFAVAGPLQDQFRSEWAVMPYTVGKPREVQQYNLIGFQFKTQGSTIGQILPGPDNQGDGAFHGRTSCL